MRRVLMLVACLVLALPGVQAANGVNLLLDGPGRVTASAPSGSAATVDGSYDLSLTYTGQHRLLVSSSVRTCATCAGLDHAAQWTLGAESLQSTRTVTATSASSYAAGNLDVTVRWTLSASTPAGTYILHAKVEALPSSPEGGAAVTRYDSADLIVDLVRPTSGGGGGGGSPPSSPPSQPPSSPPSSPPATPPSSPPPTPPAPPPDATREPASQALKDALANVLGPSYANAPLVLVRDRATGRLAGVEGVDADLRLVHLAPDLGMVYLHERATGRPVLLQTDSNQAHAVAILDGVIVEDAVVRHNRMTVEVQQKEGWIEVQVPDLYPDRPVLGAVANSVDGQRTVPLSLLWRGDGVVHLLDDPTTTYTLTFASPSSAATASSNPSSLPQGDTGLPQAVVWLGIIAAFALGVVVTVAWLRRPRA